MRLQDIFLTYRPEYEARYGATTTPAQWSALNAITGCRTPQYGAMTLQCTHCHWQGLRYQSCGHRSCSQCHHHSNVLWCDRQCQKLLPVPYFMLTFTLPAELRALARRYSKVVYGLLFEAAIQTLRQFSGNDKALQAELAASVVLHTHTRRLDYHPHVHLVVPGGAVQVQRREWRKVRGRYLFNNFNLATVFRAIFLKKCRQAGLDIPANPKNWVADCKAIGTGKTALQYLSRYLYRGLLSDRQIIHDDGRQVTFSYLDSQSKSQKARTVNGEDLIHLLLQHVLPKGFRRARDYGFLHGNAKKLLTLLQWLLNVVIPATAVRKKAIVTCPCCKLPARIVAFLKPRPLARLKPD